jgi:2-oxoglutarate dehydrogenase E2 component (dihydrolipoamide succinyltransferase)
VQEGETNLQSSISDREMAPSRSRWESLVWPRWLPIRARLPLIAQITGALALIAAVMMPQSSEVAPVPAATHELVAASAPAPGETPAALAAPVTPEPPAVKTAPARPAHLNLDLRHSFRSVELSVTVDDKRVLNTVLEGGGKKFGMFGRRAERSYTRTLDLQPGARVVRLRVKSAQEKFEHSRVERFDLGPASVATMRIDIEKSGLSVIADRPAPPAPDPAPAPVTAAAAPAPPAAAPATELVQGSQAAQAAQAAHEASAVAALYQSLRSVLITLAGLIGSTATAFVVQEFLKQRRMVTFGAAGQGNTQAARILRRRRERRSRHESDISIDAGLS